MRSTFLWAFIAVCACSGRRAPPRALVPVEVELSGCRPFVDNSRCVPPPDGQIRVLLVKPKEGAVVFSSTTASAATPTPLAARETLSEDGRLFAVKVPPGAGALVLAVRRPDAGEARHTIALARLHPIFEQARRKRAQDPHAAIDLLRSAEPRLGAGDAARARSLRARFERAAGRTPEAEGLLVETIPAHRAARQSADAVEDAFMLAFLRLGAGRFSEARQALDGIEPDAHNYPDGWARLPHFQALVARRTGDLRGALKLSRLSEARARRLGLASDTRQNLASVLRELGRSREADQLLAEAVARPTESTDPCQPAVLLMNRAWARLFEREASRARAQPANPTALPFPDSRAPKEDPDQDGLASSWLRQAVEIYSTTCKQPTSLANAHTNLALAAMQGGDVEESERELALARKAFTNPPHAIISWWLDIEARIHLQRGRAAAALETYRRLERLGLAAFSPETRWRAALGRGRAHERLKQLDRAVEAYRDAEAVLDDERFWIPVTEGRDTFLGRRETSARSLVALLLRLGRNGEALGAARRARVRALGSMARVDELAELNADARERWDTAMGTFERERLALAAESAADWQQSVAELERTQAKRQAKLRRLEDLLDTALSVFRGSDGARAKRDRAPGAPPPAAPGEALLVYFEGDDGWLGFASAGGNVTLKRLGALDVRVAPGELGEKLLAPFITVLRAAREIRIVPSGALRNVDFHALPIATPAPDSREARATTPLVSLAPVSYPLDLPVRAEYHSRAAIPRQGLVVSNPREDLPAAALEGKAVMSMIAKAGWAATPLEGPAATRDRLRSLLATVDLFHYAGHGEFTGFGGWESGLPLARADRFTVGDILTLVAAPGTIVLSGCETGRASEDAPVDGIGLAQAFLLAGAHEVVAAVRPVRDQSAAELIEAFYRALVGGQKPVEALRSAQQKVGEGADWAAFRLFTQ